MLNEIQNAENAGDTEGGDGLGIAADDGVSGRVPDRREDVRRLIVLYACLTGRQLVGR